MNRKVREKEGTDLLNQLATQHESYISPHCETIPVEQEYFICTSVIPNQGGSTEPDFDEKGDIDGGDWEVEEDN